LPNHSKMAYLVGFRQPAEEPEPRPTTSAIAISIKPKERINFQCLTLDTYAKMDYVMLKTLEIRLL
jgi:hypothetical protein